MMVEQTRRLQLRYNPGQFTFSRFEQTASHEELHDLALKLNCFQQDEVQQIVLVQVFDLM